MTDHRWLAMIARMGATETVTVTVMVTAAVGSAALLEAVGDEEARRVRRNYVSTLRSGLEAHRGREIRNVGDGLTVVFSSTAAAVDAAVEMQQRARREVVQGAQPLGVRIGVATGDADVNGDDVVGRPVLEAERLCAAAAGGQVLVTELVGLLCGARNEHELTPMGEIELEGPGTPFKALEVRYSPEQTSIPDRLLVPLPGPLATDRAVAFVPRPAAWDVLGTAWETVRAGDRRAVFVGGEAGTGKTRLVAEFARGVLRQGGLVLFGASSPDIEAPFQPFVQALTHALEALTVDARVALGGSNVTDLDPLLPNLFGAPARVDRPEVDAETERYRRFEAVTSLLAAIGRRSPVLLVLDDLHWARRPTLQLLDHVLRSTRLTHIFVLVTYRNVPADIGEPLLHALAGLRRAPGVDHIDLPGFDRAGVRAFVEAVAGHDIDATAEPLVTHLVATTDGNAFLLGELWRHLLDVGCLVRLNRRWVLAAPLSTVRSPESVRQVVARRLAGLPEQARSLLELAAVAGVECDVTILSAAAKVDELRAIEALEPAIDLRLLDDVGGRKLRFAHALVRQAVEDRLTPSARRRHHLAIATALERARPDAVDALAHHFGEAVPLAPSRTAVQYARRAAAHAMDASAHDDAVAVLTPMLDLAEGFDRIDVLLDLAAASALTSDTAYSRLLCAEAASLARRAGDRGRLVRAALVTAEANWRGMVADATAGGLLQEALAASSDTATRARLLAGLGAVLALTGQIEDAIRTGDESIALARLVGDPRLLLVVMHHALFVDWRPDTAARLLEIAEEALSLARTAGDDDAELKLGAKLILGLSLSGDAPRLRIELRRFRDLARRFRQQLYGMVNVAFACIEATNEGRFADAETLAEEFRSRTESLPDAAGGYGVQMFTIRREQGRLADVRPMLELVTRVGQHAAAWRPGLAAAYAEVGLLDDASRLLAELVDDDLAAVQRDSLWAGVLTFLADACASTRHRQAAEVLHRHLLPYKGLVVGMTGLAYYGSADRYLGKLAEVRERPAEAVAHLEAAVRLDEAIGWPVWIAHSRFELGRLLASRGLARDRERSNELLRSALASAESLGMAPLAKGCRAALHPQADSGRSHTVLTARELVVLRLVAEGRTNQEIGEQLHTSRHTVANQIRAILLKTGCRNRTEASAWAHDRDLTTG